jgi:hypothetical protein
VLSLSIPGIAVFAILLVVAIRRFRAWEMFAVVVRGGFVPEQEVSFPAAGRYLLWLECPALRPWLPTWGLRFVLLDPLTGTAAPHGRVWLGLSSSGLRRRRFAHRTFTVAHRGAHVLRIEGLAPDRDCSQLAVAFGPGFTAGAVAGLFARVGGIFLGGAGLIGCLVVTGLLLFGPAARGDGTLAPAAGRTLRAAADSRGWRDAEWNGIHVRLPPGWTERTRSATDVDWRAPEGERAFFIVRVTPYPIEGPPDQLLAANVAAAEGRLRMKAIEGYAVRTIDGVPGVLTIGTEREGTLGEIVWSGITGEDGARRSIDVLAGAFDGTFDRLEPVLGAMFASMRLAERAPVTGARRPAL